MIEFSEVSKSFGFVLALDRFTAVVRPGAIHAFLGENGAGKSTLMKILSGALRADNGVLAISGRCVNFRTPLEAINYGIVMMHQNFSVIDGLKVWENFVYHMNFKNNRSSKLFLSRKKISEIIASVAESLKYKVDPNCLVADLSEGEKQKLEIIKIIMSDARIIILDEPSALLTPFETDTFLARVRQMAKAGKTVIMITHKIREVLCYADMVTVMRKGKLVKTSMVQDTDTKDLINSMLGNYDLGLEGRRLFPKKTGSARISCKDVLLQTGRGKTLGPMNFSMAPGEILGIAGVGGEGQVELAEMVAGFQQPREGKLCCDVELEKISFIPEDSRSEGVIEDFSLLNNLFLRDEYFRRKGFCDGWFFRQDNDFFNSLMDEYGIVPKVAEFPARYLSGGNLQRFILAREMSVGPSLLVALYPTRGLDVKGARFVRDRLVFLADSGTSVFFVSEELDELLLISNRIMVIGAGRAEIFQNDEKISIERIGYLMGEGFDPDAH